MTDRPDDLTQPISPASTSQQPAVDAAQPAAAGGPAWATAAHEGDGTASARPVPVAAMAPTAPMAAYGPSIPPVAAAPAKPSWRSRVSGGRGLAVAALVVGLGLGAVGGAAVAYAATAGDDSGSIADGTGGFGRDGTGRFDRDGDGDFGHGGHLPGGDSPEDGGSTGQLPGGGTGTDVNGTGQAT